MTAKVPGDGVIFSVTVLLSVISVVLGVDRGISGSSNRGGRSPSSWIRVAMLGDSVVAASDNGLLICEDESMLPNDCDKHSIFLC